MGAFQHYFTVILKTNYRFPSYRKVYFFVTTTKNQKSSKSVTFSKNFFFFFSKTQLSNIIINYYLFKTNVKIKFEPINLLGYKNKYLLFKDKN